MENKRVKTSKKVRVQKLSLKQNKYNYLKIIKVMGITEAGALREYIKIKKAEQAVNFASLRKLLNASSLTISEARPFYELAEKMEKEAIK